MRWLFRLVVLVFRGDQAKDAELLVLRHENVVLRRTAGRIRYEPADRAWFAALAQPPEGDPEHRPGSHPPGEGEPAVGLPADPRRADQARRHRCAAGRL